MFEKIHRLVKSGKHTSVEVCKAVGMDRKTLYNWRIKNNRSLYRKAPSEEEFEKRLSDLEGLTKKVSKNNVPMRGSGITTHERRYVVKKEKKPKRQHDNKATTDTFDYGKLLGAEIKNKDPRI